MGERTDAILVDGCNPGKVQRSSSIPKRKRRLWAEAEAKAYGEGGVTHVAETTGMSPMTVSRGIKELEIPVEIEPERVRRVGGGCKRLVDSDPTLKTDLEKLVEPSTRGEADSPLRWTTKSLRKLAAELRSMGHNVSHFLVAEPLHEMGYSLQANRETEEDNSHPDRDAQFQHIKGFPVLGDAFTPDLLA